MKNRPQRVFDNSNFDEVVVDYMSVILEARVCRVYSDTEAPLAYESKMAAG
ncbi:MAG: hypothetical protein PHD43_14305 [Methylococcales bacterium]|nr:hypothetical protein [Methylococcales bacterium]